MLIHLASDKSTSSLSEYTEDQIQPNAIDLRLDRVWRFKSNSNVFVINEREKTHALKTEMFTDGITNEWILVPGTYEVQFQGTISIGADEAGWVITRSTLNRNGVFITSGLYDSKYTGPMAGVLHVSAVPMRIERGTRVGQFMLYKAQALHAYNGSYGLDVNGKMKSGENYLPR